jgi:catechol 2,3-dioxygenase-like lactoylglutathione lyase family enzyme
MADPNRTRAALALMGAAALLGVAAAGCRRDKQPAPSAEPASTSAANVTPVASPQGCLLTHPSETSCGGANTKAATCGVDARAPCALGPGVTSPPAGMISIGGVTQDADVEPTATGGAIVRAWPPGHEEQAIATISQPDGRWGFAAPPGTTLMYRADRGDFLAEVHAATLEGDGVKIDLQLRHPAFFTRALESTGRRFDASRGLVIVELLGAPHGGVGARLTPHGDAPFVFDAPFTSPTKKAVEGERLLDGGHHFIVFANVAPGETKLEILDGAGLTCAAVGKLERWPVIASVITQIDITCRAR